MLSRHEGAGGFAGNGTSEVASGAIIWLLLAHSSGHKAVVARLDRATQYSRDLYAARRDLRIKIIPVRIVLFDQ